MARTHRSIVHCATAGLIGLTAVGAASVIATGTAVAHPAAKVHLATATSPAPASSADFTLSFTMVSGSTTKTVTGNGQVDFAHHAVSAHLTLPALGSTTTSPTALNAELVSNTAYVQVPAAFSQLAGGAQWISVALPASATTKVTSGFEAAAAAVTDASSIVTTLTAKGGTVTSRSSGVFNGSPVHETVVSVDVAKLLATFSELPSGAAAKITGATGATVPVKIWANSAGQLVQISFSHAITTGKKSATVAGVLSLSDIDGPVTIAAPPAGEVKAISPSMLQGLAAMGSSALGLNAKDARGFAFGRAGHHRNSASQVNVS
jgi:hypothetical protein